MPSATFASELARYGPQPRAAVPTLAESQAYCSRLARTHYENFTVASRLLPRALREHFYAVYAYCRWADDLADETAPEMAGPLLDWWEEQLASCYLGRADHPVFVALQVTIREFGIPAEPFAALLRAFRQDQSVRRYETFADLLKYCEFSANPVGHLVLYLGRCFDPGRAALSDSVCTGLQLANFWQDVAQDWDRGRVYLPQEDCRKFGYLTESFAGRQANSAFRELLAFEVDRAETWLRRGLPLVDQMPPALSGDVWLFIHGGLAILNRIRGQRHDVWSRRPRVSKLDRARLLAGCLWRNRRVLRRTPG